MQRLTADRLLCTGSGAKQNNSESDGQEDGQ